MRTLIRAATLVIALEAAGSTATLAAQQSGGPGTTAPACALVTEKEVEAATGLDYRPGDDVEPEYEWIKGGATCFWGGPGGFAYEDLPEIHVTFLAASAGGSYTERQEKQRPAQGCTREVVHGVGDRAFAEICEGRRFGVSVYARTGNNDVVVRVYHLTPMAKASVKPAAIALAKAAAARAKGI